MNKTDSPSGPLQHIVSWMLCKMAGHRYRVLRRMNAGSRKVGCDRCGGAWGMHDATRSFVPWDADLEACYAPGGPLREPHDQPANA